MPTPPLPYTEATSGGEAAADLRRAAKTSRSSASDSARPVKCSGTGGHWSGGREAGSAGAAGLGRVVVVVAQVATPTRSAAAAVTPTLAIGGISQSSDAARMLAAAAAIPAATGAATPILPRCRRGLSTSSDTYRIPLP